MKKSVTVLVIIAVCAVAAWFFAGRSGAPAIQGPLPTPTVAASAKPIATANPSPAAQATPAGTYSKAQVAKHNTGASCWTSINGSVYDVTGWINQHPGGAGAILMLCGKDGTAAFMGQHGSAPRPAQELASFKVGTLAQ